MPTALDAWRRRWIAAGLPVIPLRPNSKAAACEAYQMRTTAEQWEEVGPNYGGNIAALCGGGIVAIDADNDDDPKTSPNVEAYLGGLGLDPQTIPTVQTSSGIGRHYYLNVAGDWPKGAYSNLAPAIGAGELRYGRGAYVVAPSSQVGGREYRFVTLYPEAIRRQRAIAWRDLYPLIGTKPQELAKLEAPPVRLVWRETPQRATTLLEALAMAEGPTKPFMGYPSRSEAEAAAVALLILAGRTFAEIAATFKRYRPGHYQEHAKPDRYIALTYKNVLTYLAASPPRLEAARLYQAAPALGWPGNGGALAFQTYRALLSTCWTFDTLTVTASLRWLGEHAAASPHGIYEALDYLQKRDLVTQAAPWQPEPLEGTTWQVCTNREQIVTGGQGSGAIEGAPFMAEIWTAGKDDGQQVGSLGRSACLVYAALGPSPQSITQLAALTGKHRNTVSEALRTLAAWDLAATQGRAWVRGSGRLEDVAEALQAKEAARRRRFQHELDREAWLYSTGRKHAEREAG